MNGDAVSGLITIIAMLTIIITFVIKERNSEAHKRLKEFKFSEENKNLECKEYEKEIKELKTINKILEEEKKDMVHISHCEEQTRFLKIRILELKGYNRRCDDSKGYIFYEHGEEFKVVALWNYAEEVFELDQKGEIFPTRESAEKSLLAKLEKEEQTKEELKKKYGEDKTEITLKCTQDQWECWKKDTKEVIEGIKQMKERNKNLDARCPFRNLPINGGTITSSIMPKEVEVETGGEMLGKLIEEIRYESHKAQVETVKKTILEAGEEYMGVVIEDQFRLYKMMIEMLNELKKELEKEC